MKQLRYKRFIFKLLNFDGNLENVDLSDTSIKPNRIIQVLLHIKSSFVVQEHLQKLQIHFG